MVITHAQEASTNHTGGHPQRWLGGTLNVGWGGTLNELRNRRPSLCSTITTTSGDSYLTATSASKSFRSLFSCCSGQLSSTPINLLSWGADHHKLKYPENTELYAEFASPLTMAMDLGIMTLDSSKLVVPGGGRGEYSNQFVRSSGMAMMKKPHQRPSPIKSHQRKR